MNSKSIGRAVLLTALAALVPWAGAARAQQGEPTVGEPQIFGEDYAPADPVWPFPLYSTHPEQGGLFVAGEFVSYRTTNPLHEQLVAQRGFTVTSPVVDVIDNEGRHFRVPTAPSGTFLGSAAPAFDVRQVSGPNDYQPGFTSEIGWKFGDGTAVSVRWLFLTERNLSASATLAPPGQNVGTNFADSFLFSPVYNFPNDFAGPTNKLTIPNPSFFQGSLLETPTLPAPGLAYGIWNGASIMTEQFLQRFQEWDITYRTPIYENENYRISGLVGPRYTLIWERYKWTASSLDDTGSGSPNWTADYSNVVANRMYGLNFGFQQECYIGHGFAMDCTLAGQLYADSTKTEVKYQLARGANGESDPGPIAKRSRQKWEISPAGELRVGVMWYPIEGVQIHAGYNVQGIFNTLSSYQPVDFNFGAVDPRFVTTTVRTLDGVDLGIAFIF